MPTVLDDLLESLIDGDPVRSVLIGAHWTVVCSRHCGMAATLASSGPHGHVQIRDAGRLHQKTVRELAGLCRSAEPMEASLGVAAINSVLDVPQTGAREVNASDVLVERGRGKNVALIGHFHFIPQLREAAQQLWVLEQQPGEDEYPAEAAADLLPQADLVAITGSTVVNHTLDGLLALCAQSATVMLLGPSTPLSPILFDHGIDILSGTVVVDEAAVLRTVSQGAGFRQVEGVKLLTFFREKES
jgi:uncharacterized protein